MPPKQERFWAKLVATEATKHADRSNHKVVTVRAGASPSGPKHIGNMNDQVRGYFIRKSIDGAGRRSRHVLTSDDMDPLRTVPMRLPDGDGIWRKTEGRGKTILTKALGKPVCLVEDPFGCHDSYADHFTELMMEDLRAIGVDLELVYVSKLYEEGAYDSFIRRTLERTASVRAVLSRFQSRISGNWVPLNPVCEECGKLTTKVTSIDMDAGKVDYECVDRVLHGEYRVRGCGHVGSTDIRRTKLPWRLEWVADWQIFETDIEPFGKEHYEGSWKSGVALAKEVYGFEPPVPLVYEFFLIDGQKMSSRMGNVYLIRDLLKIAEPEVIRFLYVKKPLVQRDIAVKKMSAVVSEFDEIERLAYVGHGERAQDAKVYYRYVLGEPKGSQPYRLPYDLATYVTRFYEPRIALERLEGSGLMPRDLSNADRKRALERLTEASNWNKMFARSPEVESSKIHEVDDPRILEGFRALQEELTRTHLGGDQLQELLYKAARSAGVPSSEFFKEAYELFIGQDSGPRLGNFLATLDRDYVLTRLRSVKLKPANR